MTLNDQKRIISLWMQFLDGNEIAFSQLYCLFFDDLLTYGRRVGGDNETVEDLIQDLFLKLYQKKITLEDNTRLRLNPEKPDVPLNKNDAFQKVQKRHVQEKR